MRHNNDKLKNMVQSWSTEVDGYIGIIYSRLYPNSIPHTYYTYWNDDGKLVWKKDEEHTTIKRTAVTIEFDTAATMSNFKSDQNIICLPISTNEYYIFSNSPVMPFFMQVLLDEGKKTHDIYFNILAEDLDETMTWIGKHFVQRQKVNMPAEFGIASVCNGDLVASWYEVKSHYKVDIEKNYNDDLPYDKICDIINDNTRAGLMLFYGEPGTGKSSLIKHLIGEFSDTQFIFLDACVLASVQPAKFVNFLTENENTVLILEDCEKILASREVDGNSIMSTILNVTDGVISDILGIKLICTFNTALSSIDKAILRKGRLSLKYEFKKLSADKAKSLGFDKEATLADIFNEEENDFSKKTTRKIGF